MSSGNYKITGKMIARLRTAKGLGQKQVAAKLKISQQAYSKIEHNGVVKMAVVTTVLVAMGSNMEELAIVNFLNQSGD